MIGCDINRQLEGDLLNQSFIKAKLTQEPAKPNGDQEH